MARVAPTLRTTLISATLAASAPMVFAQAADQTITQPPINQPATPSVAPTATPATPAAPVGSAQPAATAAPQSPAAAARADLAKARENLAAVTRKLQASTETAPEQADAQKAVTTTKAAYDDARAKAIATLANNPDYKAAQANATATRQRMNELAASGQATPDSRLAAASAALSAKEALNRIQNQVLDADPNVKQAKAAYDQSSTALAKYRDQNATFANNPEWVAARDAVEAARTKLAQAEAPAAAAAAQPAAAQVPPTTPQQQLPPQQRQRNVAPTPIHPLPQQ